MAASIVLAVRGNNQITDQVLSEDFYVDSKFEYEFNDMVIGDGYTTLPISKINPISKILSNSDGPLEIKINYGTSTESTYCSGICYLCVDPNYANLSGIAIGTSSASSVNGFISILNISDPIEV